MRESISRPTCAACEHYGNAFCKNHIQKFIIPTIANIVNNSYMRLGHNSRFVFLAMSIDELV
jgi:hypothetical protein